MMDLKIEPDRHVSDLTVADLEILITQIVRKALAQEKAKPPVPPPEALLATFGSWQDERNAEEIIQDIYASRTIAKGHAL